MRAARAELEPTPARRTGTVEARVTAATASVVVVDTVMAGLPGVTAVHLLTGSQPAIVDTGPASSLDHTFAGLEAAGVRSLRWIVLTHIHLDHAGACGDLVRRFPDARVVVRVEGAPHLVDPSRLWASAARLYPDMEARWGHMLPVPEDRIVAVTADGPVADLGDGRSLEAVYTPGHARHHMALWEPAGGVLFAGDALGVFLPSLGSWRPATPPPEFSLEEAIASVDRLRRLAPRYLHPTHFGPVPDPDAAFDAAIGQMEDAVALARPVVEAGGGIDEVAAALAAARVASGSGSATSDELDRAASDRLNAAGIVRYLTRPAAGRS